MVFGIIISDRRIHFIFIRENNLEFITISNYVLVTHETIPAYLVLLTYFVFWVLCGLIAEKSRIGASLLFFAFFSLISIFYSNNGPDKGSYATIFLHLKDFSDVFHYTNTIDSPVYYISMVFTKMLGMSYDTFFIFQNLIITFVLAYVISKQRQGVHLAFYLIFSHFLIPFSVRGHLLVLTFLFINTKQSKIFWSPILLFIHPLISIFPLLALNSENILKYRKLFLILFLLVAFLCTGFFYSKMYAYIIESAIYANKVAIIPLGVILALLQLYVFYPPLKDHVNSLEKVLLFLPLVSSCLAIFFPMFGRLVFAFDVVYIMLVIKYSVRLSFMKIFLLTLFAFVRFAKNYLIMSYFIL
ncbi:hypothetical protein C9J40_03900 [Photobacterium sp. GB-72]|nr:hypothetical protein C9J40_03900 [Photobacterium sp. GB-72]